MYRILVIDDELVNPQHTYHNLIKNTLEKEECNVEFKGDMEGAIEVLKSNKIDLVLLDLIFESKPYGGREILEEMRKMPMAKSMPVIVLTVRKDINAPIEVFNLKPQPIDYIVKSEEAMKEELIFKIKIALAPEIHELVRIIGFVEEPSKKIFRDIMKAAKYDVPVFIEGETGTGKELVAKAIHFFSPRKDKEFVPIYCGGLTETLFESELFGHKKGSFTGAYEDKEGLVKRADGGTLFLDEICNVPIPEQIKLLRFLQPCRLKRNGVRYEFRKVGSTKIERTNIRVIAATNKNPYEEINKEDGFREDLFNRLNVFHIYLPPLRDRKEDIPILGGYLVAKCNNNTKTNIQKIEKKVESCLKDYLWPGNVRELENLITAAAIIDDEKGEISIQTVYNLIESRKIQRKGEGFLKVIGDVKEEVKNRKDLKKVIKEIEIKVGESVLQECNNKVGVATQLLGVSKKWLKRKNLTPQKKSSPH